MTAVQEVKARYAGLAKKSVEIELLFHGKSKTMTANYLERKAHFRSFPPERKDLIIIPGFSLEAMGMADLVIHLSAPKGCRIIVMELPLHGKNISNFDGEYFSMKDMLQYVRVFIQEIRSGNEGRNQVPLHIFGYSLGGGLCLNYLCSHEHEISSAMLLTPATYDTVDDDFTKLTKENPRCAHAWETFEECKQFATSNVGLGFYPDVVPDIVFKGMTRERHLRYGIEEAFFEKFFSHVISGQHQMPRYDLKNINTPVLLVTAGRDKCINAEKCRVLVQQAMRADVCKLHHLEDVGHFGGSRNSPYRNILQEFAPIGASFLFDSDVPVIS